MIERILFITLSNIGDVILTTPCLSVLRGNFPKAKITVLVGPRAFGIFASAKTVDEVIVYDKTLSLWDKWLLVRELQRYDFDMVVDLRNTVIPFLLGAPHKTPLSRAPLKKITSKREQHLACLKSAAKKLNMNWDLETPFDFYSQEDIRKMRQKLAEKKIEPGELILITPGAQSSLKRWTLEGFAVLADRLIREQRKKVVLAGSKADMPVVDGILSRSAEGLADFTGETSFRELAALMSLSQLVISNDSAPLQLAYELKIPVVALFGPTDYRKFGRVSGTRVIVRRDLPCSPCGSAQCLIPETKACLVGLDPDEVYRACLEILGKKEFFHAENS